MDATNNLIDEVYQDDLRNSLPSLAKLLADKYFPLVSKPQENSEGARGEYHHQPEANRQPACCARVPYFPANAVLK
ncbi:P2 family phage major capsid protein [Salmonella enterica subsp. enterica]|nr:P2 family phage major capsid protein [Salmonella enterica subsp. enterica]